MDKHKQISIKINGKQPKVKKEQKEKTDFVETKKPRIVIENEEVAAAHEEEEDDFTWVLPDESLKSQTSKEKDIPVIPIEDLRHPKTKGPSKVPFKPNKPKKPKITAGFQLFTLKQLVVSIALAIILGTGFGFMILKVVDDGNAGPNETEVPSQPSTSNGETPATGNEEETPANSQAAIDLETFSAGIIQGGKFSTAESANTTVSDIKAKGFAATSVEMDGAFFVIAGIGNEQGSVGGIKNEYQESFPDFFAKTFEVPGGSYSNAGQGDSEAIKVSLPVYKELVALSSEAFSTGALDKGQLENLSTQINAVKEKNTDKLHDDLKKFHSEIETAFTQIKAFANNSDQKSLWQSQQSLLNAFQNYTVWVSKIQ